MQPERSPNDASLLPIKRATERVNRLALIAIVGAAFFFISVVALHLLRSDYDPITHYLSDYELGPYGFLMTAAFLALGLGSLALALGLYYDVTPSWWLWIGLFLLAGYGIGNCILGLFTADSTVAGSPQTLRGAIHGTAAFPTYLSITIAALLLPQAFKRDERWRKFYRLAVVSGIAVLASMIVPQILVSEQGLGLAQRIWVIMQLVWLLLTAVQLRSTRSTQPAQS